MLHCLKSLVIIFISDRTYLCMISEVPYNVNYVTSKLLLSGTVCKQLHNMYKTTFSIKMIFYFPVSHHGKVHSIKCVRRH